MLVARLCAYRKQRFHPIFVVMCHSFGYIGCSHYCQRLILPHVDQSAYRKSYIRSFSDVFILYCYTKHGISTALYSDSPHNDHSSDVWYKLQ